MVRPHHVLHRQAQVDEVPVAADVDVSRWSSSGSPWYQGIFGLPVDDVVAVERADRDEREVGDAEARRRTRVNSPRIAVEHVLRIADEVHLVDRDEHARDAEQRGDEGVALRLRQDAVRASIRMIARSAVEAPVAMLRVYCSWPGRVGDDEVAARGVVK